MNTDEPAGQGTAPGPGVGLRHDQRVVAYYRVAVAALLVALGAADYVAFHLEKFRLDNSTSSADAVADSAVYCGIMLGIAYYLGRTRSAVGGQQLRWLARLISVIPVWGLIQISTFQGVNGQSKSRLAVRNLAIIAGSVLIWSSWNDLRRPVAGSVAMAVLQVTGIVLAVQMSLKIPVGPLPEAGNAPPATGSTPPLEPRPTAGVPDDSPADEVIDVSPLAAGARRLYWLAGAMKFGAIFFVVLPVGAQSNVRPFIWVIASAGALAALAIAVLMQEDWIRPPVGFAVALGLTCAACFVPTAFGMLSLSVASQGLLLWAVWPLPFLWLYQRQRRSSRLSDAQIQDASRIGHLPRRQGAPVTFRMPSPGLWIRGIVGMLCAIPVVLVGLVNTIVGVLVIQNWIQAALDEVYAFARGSFGALAAGATAEERVTVTLATPPEAEAFQLQVRGDLLYWGKLSFPPLLALRVPFAEFLRARLEAYAKVRVIQETPSGSATAPAHDDPSSLVVMPIGVPYGASYPPDVISAVAALGARMPLLLPVQPMGRPLEQWPLAARVMRDHGIALPSIDDPVHTIAVLRLATGEKIIFTAQRRNQWGYIAVIHEVLRVTRERADEVAGVAQRPHDSTPVGVGLRGARERLFDAAERVLLRDGPSGLTSRAVTHEAGIAKGALHRHFTDFDDFLAGLVHDRATRLAMSAAALIARAGSRSVAGNLAEALTEALGPVTAAIIALITFRDELRRRLRETWPVGLPLIAEIVAMVRAYLRAEQSLGRIAKEADPGMLSPMLIGSVHLLLADRTGEAPPPDAVRELIEGILSWHQGSRNTGAGTEGSRSGQRRLRRQESRGVPPCHPGCPP